MLKLKGHPATLGCYSVPNVLREISLHGVGNYACRGIAKRIISQNELRNTYSKAYILHKASTREHTSPKGKDFPIT